MSKLSDISMGLVAKTSLEWMRATASDRGGNPVPKPAFAAFVAAQPDQVVELIIADVVAPPFYEGRLLLEHRSDSGWNGWHTIGGFVQAGETRHEACLRHAKRAGLAIRVVTEVGLEGMIGWRDDVTHPYGTDNNGHLCQDMFLCELVRPVVETDILRWFGREEVPNMLRGHQLHRDSYYNYTPK